MQQTIDDCLSNIWYNFVTGKTPFFIQMSQLKHEALKLWRSGTWDDRSGGNKICMHIRRANVN